MAIPIVENFSVGIQPSNLTTVTTDTPGGTAAGELLFFLHGSDGGSRVLTPPTDATSIDETATSGIEGEISRKVAGSGEPSTQTATTSGGERQILGCLRISGFDPAEPIHDFLTAIGNSATPTCPEITTTKANCLIIRGYVCNDFALAVEDAGYPSGSDGRYNRESGNTSGHVSSGIATEGQTLAGPSGTAEFALTQAENWVAWTVAIPEDPGGGGGAEGAALHHFLKNVGAR